MTVAFDQFSNHPTGGAGNLNHTHTPVGTPRGVMVFVVHDGTTDNVTSVTYGGVEMEEMAGSPNILSGGEGHVVYGYFLGESVPTGAQTVAVTVGGAGNKGVGCVTLTADADTEIVDVDATIQSTSAADPSVTLSLGGRDSFCMLAFGSGHDAVTSVTPLSSWTSRNEGDFGTEVGGWYTYDTIDSTDVTAGWTQTAEDATMIAVAVSEVAAGDPEGGLIGGKLLNGGLLLRGVLIG